MMKRKKRDDEMLKDFYSNGQFDTHHLSSSILLGRITEKDKFVAAKQILLGLAVLYILTIIAYLYNPTDGNKLLDICTTSFPPLATLILVAYFRDKHS